jgi:hypothetical protein
MKMDRTAPVETVELPAAASLPDAQPHGKNVLLLFFDIVEHTMFTRVRFAARSTDSHDQ